MQGIEEIRGGKLAKPSERKGRTIPRHLIEAVGRRPKTAPVHRTQRYQWTQTRREERGEHTKLIDDVARGLEGPGRKEEQAAGEIVAEMKGEQERWREDGTGIPYVAIDPAGAKDRDDAIWCEETRDGWELWIAVADVAACVTEGSVLDVAARKRGNTIYLPDRTIAMLPAVLSEEVCSLDTRGRKRALVTRLGISREGIAELAGRHAMEPAWIRVHEAVSYGNAEKRAGEAPFKALADCAKALRGQREREGAVLIEECPEVAFGLDAGDAPRTLSPKSNGRAGEWIEEAMIAANRTNARWLAGRGGPGGVFRIHPAPSEDSLRVMERITRSSLDQRLKRQGLLERMEKATYRPEPGRHYGIGADAYSHTTSPIRRYADLLCQRAAHAAHGSTGQTETVTASLCKALDEAETRGVQSEREAVKRWCAFALGRHPMKTGPGIIIGVQPFGIFVEMDRLPGVQGMVHVSRLGKGWVEWTGTSLECEVSGREWHEGQRITGHLIGEDPWQGHIGVSWS